MQRFVDYSNSLRKLFEGYFLFAHQIKQTGMGPRILCLSIPPTQGTRSRMEDIEEKYNTNSINYLDNIGVEPYLQS